jgi:large subunit ribosomal protein L18
MSEKVKARLRRAKATRAKIKELNVHRLCIHRTLSHTYAQVITPAGDIVVASASTLDKELHPQIKHGANVDAAKIIGEAVARRALSKGVKTVAFDRSGYRYHGRVKALADAAREAGLQF